MYIHLDEKMNYPENYAQNTLKSKGFSRPCNIYDFPVRDKAVILVIRRRVWTDEQGKILANNYEFCSEGTRYTKEFGAFLKEANRQ